MNWSTTERMTYAALAGVVATAVPPTLYWLVDRTDDSILIAWFVAPFLGPLVFQLISRRHPEWGWGLAFAAFLAVVLGIWAGIDPPFEHSGAGQAALIGVLIFASTFLAGMVGACVASLIGRLFVRDEAYPERGPQHLRPWHVGAAVVAVEMVTVAAIAAAMA